MRLLQPLEVADMLGVSRSTVRRMIIDGAIPSVVLKAGRRKKIFRVREESLNKWIIGKETNGGSPKRQKRATDEVNAEG